LSSIAQRHKLIKKIKDEKFDEEKLQRYTLLAQIGAKDFQVAVVDNDDSRLIFFEDYVFNEVNTQADLQTALQALFDGHEYLMAGFWKEVRLSLKTNKFIQVPSSLYIDSAMQEYLQFNAAIDPETETVKACRNDKSDAVTVFCLQQSMMAWLTRVYANSTLKLYHQSSALIEGVLNSSVTASDKPLYVYVDRFKLHVLYVNDGKLIYYNQFQIKQFADYVRYIMLVMKALGMDQESTRVVLWGYIGKNSPHYQEFVKYVRNISFGPRPVHLKYGYIFDEIQEHHFFDLYSMNLLPS
jgi:hypothetical protein